MKLYAEDIQELDRISRLKLVNSISGVKPANLVGTVNKEGQSNLAIFSSVFHLGSDPALLGLIARPLTKDSGHTLRNIQEIGEYTINHVHEDFIKKAHYTSAKFAPDISEFDRCALEEYYVKEIKAPFVKESKVKIGLEFKQAIPIEANGTTLVIGQISYIELEDKILSDEALDLEAAGSTGISGLNSYYALKRIEEFPYVRLNEVPEFVG
ncbi:MAG: flavin reductase family protein [Flavobacteriaceae bacterium]